MPRLIDFAGFIFDLDGLVLDTEPTYFGAWQQAIRDMGFQLNPDTIKSLSGYSYQQIEIQLQAWLGEGFDFSLFRELSAECWWDYIHEHGIAVKKGVYGLLDFAELHGIPVCLATNSSFVYAQKCLAIAGLEQRFPMRVTCDDVRNVKPAPDIFLTAAEQMQVDIRHCVIFEDSLIGITAAVASGAYTVCVPSICPVHPEILALSHCVLDDLTQVFDSLPTQATLAI